MSTLIIYTRMTGANSWGREALDVALTSAAFDIETRVAFTGEAIAQLLRCRDEQQANRDHQRRAGDLLAFGINTLYYLKQDLERYGLREEQLLDGCTPIAPGELRAMIASANCVQSF